MWHWLDKVLIDEWILPWGWSVREICSFWNPAPTCDQTVVRVWNPQATPDLSPAVCPNQTLFSNKGPCVTPLHSSKVIWEQANQVLWAFRGRAQGHKPPPHLYAPQIRSNGNVAELQPQEVAQASGDVVNRSQDPYAVCAPWRMAGCLRAFGRWMLEKAAQCHQTLSQIMSLQ